jgi:hypothetical protein
MAKLVTAWGPAPRRWAPTAPSVAARPQLPYSAVLKAHFFNSLLVRHLSFYVHLLWGWVAATSFHNSPSRPSTNSRQDS